MRPLSQLLLSFMPSSSSSSVLFYVHRDHKDIRDGEPRRSTSAFTQPRSSGCAVQVQCWFTSTETVSTVRDAEPRTPTSFFSQLLSSHHPVQVQCCFTSTETARTVRDGVPSCAALSCQCPVSSCCKQT